MDKVIYRPNKPKRESSRNETGRVKFLNGWVAQTAFIVVSVILLYSVYKSVNITSQKLDILRQAENEVQSLRLENLHLSIEVQDMSTDEYLEKEARNRLNFGADGEIVFVLPQGSMELAKVEVEKALESDKNEVMSSRETIDIWFEFLTNGI